MTTHRPTLLIATDTSAYNTSAWSAEGYNVHHIPYATVDLLEDTADNLESSDRYALIGIGPSAASAALEFATYPSRTLVAVSAYYPSKLPEADFHPNVRILLHLPATTPFVPKQSERMQVRVYPRTLPLFAEGQERGFYDGTAEGLAWMRTLELVRAAIGPRVDLEGIVGGEDVLEAVVGAQLGEMVKVGLLARTVGVDRVVDEVVVDTSVGSRQAVIVRMVRGGQVVSTRVVWTFVETSEDGKATKE